MNDFNDVYEKLLHQIKLKSYPVAVKIFKKKDIVPEATGARKVKEPLTLCQSVYIARIYGERLLLTNEDLACAYSKRFLGLGEVPEFLFKRMASAGRCASSEIYKAIINAIPNIPVGEASAFLLFPLHKVSMEPDVILAFVNPAQLLVFLHAYTWASSDPPKAQLFSEGGTCSAISTPYVTKKGCVSIPCYGTRALGLAQDDEVIFSFPTALLPEIMENLKNVSLASAYPITQHVEVTPRPPFSYLIGKESLEVLKQRQNLKNNQPN